MPLSRAEFNTFCGRLPATSFVEQWGGAQVWVWVCGRRADVGVLSRRELRGVNLC